MANDNDVQLEGYRDLSKWNDRDIQTVITFDKIFLPASMGACLLSLAKEPQTYPFVYGGSVLFLLYWLILSLRYRARIFSRFQVMHGIEYGLGFRAHSVLPNKLGYPRDRTLRKIFFGFFVIMMLIPIILHIICPTLFSLSSNN